MSEIVESIGLIELVKRMLSRRTLPHIALVALVSACLMVLTGIDEGLAAVMFLSFSISYLVIAFTSGSELMKRLTTLPEEKQDGNKSVRILKSFKICFKITSKLVRVFKNLIKLSIPNFNKFLF